MPCESDQVTAVLRALALLNAFGVDEPRLSMVALVRRTGIPKTTALRLARTLEVAGYLVQTHEKDWRLGPAVAWLGARYQMAFDLNGAVLPALRDLSRRTSRPASFFVHEGSARIRLMRVEAGSNNFAVPIGEKLPLDKGSPGKVILAFLGEHGPMFDIIRRRGFHITIGEVSKRSASVSAPVFGVGWTVVGAINISCDSHNQTETALECFAPAVVDAGRRLSTALMRGNKDSAPVKPPESYWHP